VTDLVLTVPVNSIVATALVAAAVWLMLRLSHKAWNAATREAVWSAVSHLERRVHMLLNDSREKGPLLLKLRLAGVVAVMLVLISVAASAPGIVVFGQTVPISVRVPVL
jgi:hypothetical protein